MNETSRKNELEIVEIRGDLKVLSQKIDTIKSNDLYHIQKSVDFINKVLWAVGMLVLGHLGIALKNTLWS